jgi:hypothetical protein
MSLKLEKNNQEKKMVEFVKLMSKTIIGKRDEIYKLYPLSL